MRLHWRREKKRGVHNEVTELKFELKQKVLSYRTAVCVVFTLPVIVIIFGFTMMSRHSSVQKNPQYVLVANTSNVKNSGVISSIATPKGSSAGPHPTTARESSAHVGGDTGTSKNVLQPPTNKAKEEKAPVEKISQGHIFLYSSFEEQTNGAGNLWQLEMWAKQVNMTVAEPFAVDSMFGVMGVAPDFNKALRFHDYYDREKWNEMVNKFDGSPLINWEEFLPNAPRHAIILHTIVRPIQPGLVVTYGQDDIMKYKPRKYEQIEKNDMVWIKTNFNITKVVTFVRNDKVANPMTLEEYRLHVFGDSKPSQVTLICVNWIGMGVTTWRIQIKSAPASFLKAIRVGFTFPVGGSNVSPNLSPSSTLLKAYEAYRSENFGNRKYIGVVFRTQAVMHYSPGDFDQRSKHLLDCSKRLRDVLDKIRSKWEIFLTYDLGLYGNSEYFNTSHDKRLLPLQDQVILDVFNGSLNMEKREKRLIKAAGGIRDKGYITLLEKTIATHADCIVLLGTMSSFVQSSANLYISLHKTNRCVVSICSESFRDGKGRVVSSPMIPGKVLHD